MRHSRQLLLKQLHTGNPDQVYPSGFPTSQCGGQQIFTDITEHSGNSLLNADCYQCFPYCQDTSVNSIKPSHYSDGNHVSVLQM